MSRGIPQAFLASARTRPGKGLPPPEGSVSYMLSILEVKPAFCSFYPGVRLRLPGPLSPTPSRYLRAHVRASSRGGTRREKQGERREKVPNSEYQRTTDVSTPREGSDGEPARCEMMFQNLHLCAFPFWKLGAFIQPEENLNC